MSPYEGRSVSVEAIVSYVALSQCGLGGYFLAAEGGDDGDPQTSAGLFVYAPGAHAVEAGARLRVDGLVREHFGRTELVEDRVWALGDPGLEAVPPPLQLPPLDPAFAWERFEAMRVRLPGPLWVFDNHELGSRGRLGLAIGARRIAPTQLEFPAPSPAVPVAAALWLDDGCESGAPIVPAHGVEASRPLRVGDRITQLEGIVDVDAAGDRIHGIAFDAVADNPRRFEPPPVGGRLRVVGFNIGRFAGLGRGGDGGVQLAKLLAALGALDADILALSEVGHGADSTALNELVVGLRRAVGGRDYRAVVPDHDLGSGAIAVALIHDVRTVMAVGPAAVLDTDVDPRFDDRRNRPVLAQHFETIDGRDSVLVSVAHLKSKAGSCAAVGDDDHGDGQGACGGTRLSAARALGDWLARLAVQADAPLLLMGDLNSYAAEPPIAALRAAGLSDLIAMHLGDAAYTYVYRGTSGYLDHALAGPALRAEVRGVGIWHINADEAPLFAAGRPGATGQGASDPFRSSDHDPVIVGLFDAIGAVATGGEAPDAGLRVGVGESVRGPIGQPVQTAGGCDCSTRPRDCDAGWLLGAIGCALLSLLGRRRR